MTAHVFIVGAQTFPLHLQHQFAGIGAKDHAHIDFNASAESKFTSRMAQTEINLVKMIADVSCIRPGDRVIFYLQQGGRDGGRFYGIFRARDVAFLDNDNEGQFLREKLGKSLTFRVLIEPDEVYPDGVTEWDALDAIKDIRAPYQMLWSLIYRKLLGLRGCTMITPYEEERLCGLIRTQNEEKALQCRGRLIDFDTGGRKIVCSASSVACAYTGHMEKFSMLPRLLAKNRDGYSFEAHLQTHIIAALGTAGDELSQILLGESRPEWLGNEVGCGVGMQSIDVLVSFVKNDMRHVMPIELKSKKAVADNVSQIQRYVDWIQQYYVPNHRSIIAPVLITRASDLSADFLERVRAFNSENAGDICQRLRMVEFRVDGDGIHYQERKIP